MMIIMIMTMIMMMMVMTTMSFRRLEVVTERLEAAADARGGAPVQPKVFLLSS